MKKLKDFNINTSRIWFVYSPFLVLYFLLVIVFHKDEMLGDEWRYTMFANNLLNGYYSPREELNLWNGPGYPILLIPFVAFQFPLISITLFNAILRYVSIVLLHRTLEGYTNRKTAFLFGIFWACYFLDFYEMSEILTETFTSFLVVLILFFTQKSFASYEHNRYSILVGLIIGYLVLTKIIFGYVLLCLIFLWIILYCLNSFFFNLNKKKLKKLGSILSISFVSILPYLIYTYSLTGRIYYLGNSGGMSLYWMSTPFENEYGDWNGPMGEDCLSSDSFRIKNFCKNHRENFKYILQYEGIKRDDAYKRIALQNIMNNPIKFLKNCIANQGRMWFNFPFSYHFQQERTLIRFIPNSILLTILFISLFLWIFNFFKCDVGISFNFLFFLLYIGGSTFLSAYPRHLHVVVPIILCCSAYLLYRTITINLKFRTE